MVVICNICRLFTVKIPDLGFPFQGGEDMPCEKTLVLSWIRQVCPSREGLCMNAVTQAELMLSKEQLG